MKHIVNGYTNLIEIYHLSFWYPRIKRNMVNSACRRLHWRIYEKDTSIKYLFSLLFQLNRSLLTSCLFIIFKISYNTHLITQHCNTSFHYNIFCPISGRYHPLDNFFIYLLYIKMKNNTGIVTDIFTEHRIASKWKQDPPHHISRSC